MAAPADKDIVDWLATQPMCRECPRSRTAGRGSLRHGRTYSGTQP